ncbi:nuclear transport factor 2 family protein [Paenibacillus sp. CFBP 13594]|uniref:nuclear transport factor 2 family protein n=1 Tax=Paenibacillus sp. CFBP 13594 TaxID=2774037 RepID=UPI001FD139F2|nr:nuclear transport factor 2 family protein [Paenibacillus sp. CFBP 13594]
MSNTATAGNTNNSLNTDANITMLNNYFRLFDASRTDDRAMKDLLSLFTQNAEIVSNGSSRTGFEVVIKTFYEYNKDIKHMWDAWVLQPDGSYRTNWAVCGQAVDGTVYAKAGIDIMRVNESGQIVYLKNVQTTEDAYNEYNS